MESKPLKRDEAATAFDQFKKAVAQIAGVPKSAIEAARGAKPKRATHQPKPG
jgi:hypothetical protein